MGATSKTDIANQAISHLNVSYEIADVDSERSQEANACRRFYDTARSQVLRDFAWPFATKFVTLPLVATQPTIEWGYSYQYPSDCLMFRRIISGLRNDTRQSRVPYRIVYADAGCLIYTDRQSAQAEYTVDISNTSFFDSDFVMALSYLLANLIAPRLTAGDPFKLGDKAMQNYLLAISKAQANAVNEEQPDQPVESEFVRARGYMEQSHLNPGLTGDVFPGSNEIE